MPSIDDYKPSLNLRQRRCRAFVSIGRMTSGSIARSGLVLRARSFNESCAEPITNEYFSLLNAYKFRGLQPPCPPHTPVERTICVLFMVKSICREYTNGSELFEWSGDAEDIRQLHVLEMVYHCISAYLFLPQGDARIEQGKTVILAELFKPQPSVDVIFDQITRMATVSADASRPEYRFLD